MNCELAGIQWGDVATWCAAIATFAAVFAALRIANSQAKASIADRARNEKHRAQLLAIESAEPVVRMRLEIAEARKALILGQTGAYTSGGTTFVKDASIYAVRDLPRGSALHDLPYPVGQCMASLSILAAMYNNTVAGLSGDRSAEEISRVLGLIELPQSLDALQAALARLAGELARYENSISAIDFLDRGDGTAVDPL